METDKLNKSGHDHFLADVISHSLRSRWEAGQAARRGGSGFSRVHGRLGMPGPVQTLLGLFGWCAGTGGTGLSLLPPEGLGTMADERAAHKAPGHGAPPATGARDLPLGWRRLRRPCPSPILQAGAGAFLGVRTPRYLGIQRAGFSSFIQGVVPAWELPGAVTAAGAGLQRWASEAPAPTAAPGAGGTRSPLPPAQAGARAWPGPSPLARGSLSP